MGQSSFVVAVELLSDAFDEYLQEVVIASVLAPFVFAKRLSLSFSFLLNLSHELGYVRLLLSTLGSFGLE